MRDDGDKRIRIACVLAIALTALALRAFDLGRSSLWYDEVVTTRLALQPGPSELLRQLTLTDATRAPLHPMLLQGWLALFGSSEVAGRSLSVLFGLMTVAVVGRIGARTFGDSAGLAAAWLAAICPPLVAYSREVRMYSLLVLLACLAWATLPGPGEGWSSRRSLAYVTLLVYLAYCHPLGLLLGATLALACLIGPSESRPRLRLWFALHAVSLALIAPWLGHYLDHDPESLTGPLPIKFLLGTPIAYVGGNSLSLVAVMLLVMLGCLARALWPAPRPEPRAVPLLAWFVVPPTALYAYSMVGHPLFGPVRYTLFSAPACLLLMAGGIAHLQRWAGAAILVGLTALAVPALGREVFAADLKADWRAASAFLGTRPIGEPLLVTSADPSLNVEVEVARDYVGHVRLVEAWPIEDDEWPEGLRGATSAWISEPTRGGLAVVAAPVQVGLLSASGEIKEWPGLRLVRLVRRPPPDQVPLPPDVR